MTDHPTARAAARAKDRRWLLPATLAGAAFLLAACGDNKGDAGKGAPAAPPPAEVGVVTVAPRPVGLVTELPGRLEASRVAQVRARVPGIVQKRLFTEGSDVRAGQPLFQIDPSSLQASVASAEATLARAQANVVQATAQAERYKPLVEANAISKQDYINAVAAQKTAEADVAAAKAAVQSGKINLGYASVVDCVKLTYIGLICWITASGVASPCPTSAPSVTSARPMRPEIGDVTDA